ncbi:hypothetical protein H8B09_25860 [Paenibacillus sp. PR3]|uniref:A-factor biosynthesis hotdog domain-containing protein n=1 Tax=Paenibacillus terricola TaxID=2763503 RepID=A0ABR8N1Z9_9BACL|nr:hypothetical protein [Paenibacillus terricola]MBD3922208.1 hypothetical protein [Paenibacillus terricola]
MPVEAVKEVRYTLTFDKSRRKEENVLVVPDQECLAAYRYMFANCLIAQDSITQGFLENNLEHSLQSITTPPDKEYMLHCFEKINLSGFSGTKRIVDKKLVHKTSEKNVMISEIELPLKTKIGLFSGDVASTTEIKLDHINQEHIEAILLSELSKQASMVSIFRFLGLDSEFYVIEEYKKYRRIVQRSDDIFIHALPVKENGNHKGMGYCLFTVYQNSKLCSSGYISGMYTNKGM